MAKQWETTTLGTLGEFRNGVNFNREQEGPGIPVLKVKDFGSKVFAPKIGLDELSISIAELPSEQLLQDGDIIVIRSNGNSALVGRSVVFQDAGRPTTFSGFCIRFRPDKNRIDPAFAAYYLRSPFVRQRFSAFGTGTGIQNLSQGTLAELPVALPPMTEQRQIAELLRTVDDKIELNRRMNETLEAIAGAVFKSWFVDFDPVRAKAEGRAPAGFSTGVAALFPAAFEVSSMGRIPSGWKVRAIGDLVKVVGGSTPRTDEPSYWAEGTIAWATPKDLAPLSTPVLLDTGRHVTEFGLAQICSGLLPKGSLLLSSRAPIGYLAISEVPVAINQGFIGMLCNNELPNLYVIEWVRANMDVIKGRANGTTFPEISKADFRPMQVVVPCAEVLDFYMSVVQPLYDRLIANVRESQTLTALRDSLLPRLMSGEIGISNLAQTDRKRPKSVGLGQRLRTKNR